MAENGERIIEYLLEQLKPWLESTPKLSMVQAEILTRQIYLVRFGLSSIDALEANPANLVAYRFAEDSRTGSLKEDIFASFIDLEIYQATGLNWEAYISLPRDEMQMIKKSVERKRQKNNTGAANALSEAEKAFKQMQGS